MQKLRRHLQESQVHVYTEGRDSEMVDVVDTFSYGIQVVQGPNGKLAQFGERLKRHHVPGDDPEDSASVLVSLPNTDSDEIDHELELDEFAACVESDGECDSNAGDDDDLLL